MVESQPSKLLVAGSIPVSRSIKINKLQELRFWSLLRLLRFLGKAYRRPFFEPSETPLKVRLPLSPTE